MLTLMPVVLANTVWIMLHQSASTEQITLTRPCWAHHTLSARTQGRGEQGPSLHPQRVSFVERL